jgi:hypothetical protein
MNSTEARIIRIEAELQELKQMLNSPLSDQKEHDIRQQIIAKEYQLTELYKQNASAGKNSYIITSNQTFPTITINRTYIVFLILIYLSHSSVCFLFLVAPTTQAQGKLHFLKFSPYFAVIREFPISLCLCLF